MGVFKNEVGRPSNETIKKRNLLKVVCFILVVIILLLAAYIVNDKLNIVDVKNKDNKLTTTKKNEEKEEKVSKEVGKNALIRVFGEYFQDYLSYKLDKNLKMNLAFRKSKKTITEYSCHDLFGDNLYDVTQEHGYKDKTGLVYANSNNSNDENYFLCSDEEIKNGGRREVYRYNDVNKAYKSLFNNDEEMPKEHYSFYVTNELLYSSIKNVYTRSFGGFGPGAWIETYIITDVIKKGDELTVKINYSRYDGYPYVPEIEGYTYIVNLSDGTELKVIVNEENGNIQLQDGTIIGNNYEITDENYIGKLEKTVTYKFVLEDGVYKLKERK